MSANLGGAGIYKTGAHETEDIFSDRLNNDYFGNYVNHGIFTFRHKLEQILAKSNRFGEKRRSWLFPTGELGTFAGIKIILSKKNFKNFRARNKSI